MEQFVLKEKIKETINSRQVRSVLFYTFNFNPKFFENYVMPLFVPGKNFSDEIIHNKIQWRNCLKEGIIPPITVYCDYYAKDNTEAPSFGYDIFCLKIPAAKGHICNFHPKLIFILVEDDKKIETLLLITGSGNITPSGWCENFESFSIEEIAKNKTFPNHTNTNIFQDYIRNVTKLSNTNLSNAEETIYNYLKYVDVEIPFFNSLKESFKEFIEHHIFENDTIKELEIISPYFSNDNALIDYLRGDKGVRKIRCLIPTYKDNEIQLARETFIEITNAGVIWCRWEKHTQDEVTYNRNNEVRNLHAKIYRFYGEKYKYTVIGSVNFTNPAWNRFIGRNNVANIECAWLYIEASGGPALLKSVGELNLNHYRFVVKQTLENPDANSLTYFRDVPEIDFTLDWKGKTLTSRGRGLISKCTFNNILDHAPVKSAKGVFDLSKQDLRTLAKNTLIEIAQETENGVAIHIFYPHQLNIDTKPLDFKLSASNILQYWKHLDDEYRSELLTRYIAEKSTDESGIVHEDELERRSLLNEMV